MEKKMEGLLNKVKDNLPAEQLEKAEDFALDDAALDAVAGGYEVTDASQEHFYKNL